MAPLVWVTVCVGEWSWRPWYNSTFIHGRLVASSLVIRQWRSRVGRWLESSHSTAEQSTTTTTRPRRQKLSSQAAVANTIMLQRTHITTLRCTQQWAVGVAVWRHLSIESLLSLSDWLITSPLTLTTLIYSYINITWTLTNYLMLFSRYSFKQRFTSVMLRR